MRRPVCVILLAAALALLIATSAVAKNGAYAESRHGDRTRGPQRLSSIARGSCLQCHIQHVSHDRSSSTSDRNSLFAPNDNQLCFACHNEASQHEVWPGSVIWTQSEHGVSSQMVWPGPEPAGRPSSDTNKCTNCHDPHGVKDSKGAIPAMLMLRQEALCTRCHDGLRAPDIRSDYTKRYVHRFSECSDCHNAHVARRDVVPVEAPDASLTLSGVARVEVSNGPAGTIPIYRLRAAGDLSSAREFEICFRCHSSYTKQAVGDADLGLLTNPANPSFHPIQARGKNRGIDPSAFTVGWNADRLIYCSDCHGSDDARVRGPHGSNNRYILKKAAITTSTTQSMTPDDLCFDCHQFDVYANPNAAPELLRASRFNSPNVAGHAYHVGVQHVPCYACHESHGSVRNAALIATRRSPGITSFLQTTSGGTCSQTCHPARSYSVNYVR